MRRIKKLLVLAMQRLASTVSPIEPGDKMLLETGDFILLESGDKILLEA